MAKLFYPFVCGLDWLQLYCFRHADLTNADQEEIKWRTEEFPTPQFKMRTRVYLRLSGRWLPFCEVLHTPRTSVLPVMAAQLKVENRALYECDLMPRLSFVMTSLDLEYRSLSRVDVYYDCNKYYGGRSPAAFISDYCRQKILKIGINRGYLNFANFGYQVANGARKMPAGFRVGAPAWTGVTWGSRDYVQTQIYNKTRELREVKYKPWIVDAWERAGLDPAAVWRTEMRIMHHGKNLKLVETGDLFALGAFEVANQHRVWELFQTFADRHLRFVFKDYHVKRQQMRPVRLFGNLTDSEVSIKPKIYTSKAHSNRTTHLVTKFLGALREYIKNDAIAVVSPHMDKQIDNVIAQLDVTFPNWQFDEKKESPLAMFRRLNDTLLRRVNMVGLPLDLFVQAFLLDKEKG